jgi:glutamate-ammonia-ligase adenylyltransferase
MTDRLEDLGLGPLRGCGGDPAGALAAAAEHSPYLALMARRHPGIVERIAAEGPDAALESAIEEMRFAARIEPVAAAMAALRRAKAAGHMAAAAADLSWTWTLDKVVGGLTRLADAAVQSALQLAVREAAAAGRLAPSPDGGMPGLFVLAMGKMGAGELNYSSDIDLIVLFDLDAVGMEASKAKDAAVRIARDVVRFLEERTEEGYVFRTDLRLRPDPNSTAIAVSTQFAEGYYESVGQNWERMAHVKARVCAGDEQAGARYLDELVPYIWRRHLDYWAIADIHSIKRQIHASGAHAALDALAFDVKLGRGGVREIEFFAQVQQLILGGRSPELRAPQTKEALRRMSGAGVVGVDIHEDLSIAYDFLRALEHRIQMVNDEQTHRLPDLPEKRAQIAALCGYAEQAKFESDIGRVRRRVHGIYSDLFGQEERLAGEGGNLVFTGVDDDPGTVETLRGMGFSDPSRIIATFQAWHRGGVSATRSARGRQLLTTLGPRLLEAMAKVGDPDHAFDRFRDFFSSLTAGVQTMSLMLAEPALTRDLLETMAFAPQLAKDLARRPALLDSLLAPEFRKPVSVDEAGAREKRLRSQLRKADGFEDALNTARRFHREEAFRIGYQLLRRTIHAAEAGKAYADLADACIAALADEAEREVLAKFSGSIGRWSVCGLGKLGGRELSASSDLDLMLIYERDESEEGESLAGRFVQRLIAALSAQTEEGSLYEVDTQLRPSGRAGPVAVKFSSFANYYRTEAWTWEFMALTRLRPVAGDAGLSARIVSEAKAALAHKSGDPALTADVLDMRRRMARERPAKSIWDLKLTPGGLVDIEFIVQHEMLRAAQGAPETVHPSSTAAIEALQAAGRLSADESAVLAAGLELQLNLQQALRIASGPQFEPEQASAGLKAWLADVAGAASFDELAARLGQIHAQIDRLRTVKIGSIATDPGPLSV